MNITVGATLQEQVDVDFEPEPRRRPAKAGSYRVDVPSLCAPPPPWPLAAVFTLRAVAISLGALFCDSYTL